MQSSRGKRVELATQKCTISLAGLEGSLEKSVRARPLRASNATVEHQLDIEGAEELQKDFK